jgi:hypothetical protein
VLDAGAGARHQAIAGLALGGEAAAAHHHVVEAAVHRLQVHRGRGAADLQRIGLDGRGMVELSGMNLGSTSRLRFLKKPSSTPGRRAKSVTAV